MVELNAAFCVHICSIWWCSPKDRCICLWSCPLWTNIWQGNFVLSRQMNMFLNQWDLLLWLFTIPFLYLLFCSLRIAYTRIYPKFYLLIWFGLKMFLASLIQKKIFVKLWTLDLVIIAYLTQSGRWFLIHNKHAHYGLSNLFLKSYYGWFGCSLSSLPKLAHKKLLN